MSWLRDLFIGFFTRHITTKLLALLLSIGLFLFVQASLTGTQEIAKVELIPALAEDTRATYILLTSSVTVTDITIRGELSKIEPLARFYKSNNSVRLPIDLRILNGTKRPDGVFEIPIDATLFREVFGKDATVERLTVTDSIKVSTLEERTGRVDVAPELAKLTHEDYEGTLTFVPNIRSVSVRGPSVAFPPDKDKELRFVVGVKGNIGDRISTNPLPGDTGVLSFGGGLCEIRWQDCNVRAEYKDFVRITPDGGTSMAASDFQRALTVSCTDATKKKVPVALEKLPIVVLYALSETINLDEYQVYPPLSDKDLNEGTVALLDVRMPAALASDEAFRENLVVILDLAAATTEPSGVLKVPYHLGLKDRTRDDDVEKLAQVAIAREPQHFEFRKP
ncbi:MAG TPA: hypothetical protein VFY93_19945 [Planctomycetota bacterium]|nr:hypothetical protein [Planctomycetota bacterium]